MSQKHTCKYCGIPLTKKSQKIYCSNKCKASADRDAQFRAIELAGEFPARGKFHETNNYIARAWLEYKYGHACAICLRAEWNQQPIPLVVDHIDGNPSNHKIQNIRLICPNCDAQLPTYKARNTKNPSYIKSGRAARKTSEYDKKLAALGLTRDLPVIADKAICPVCNTEFQKKHSRQLYCSKPCAAKALRKA